MVNKETHIPPLNVLKIEHRNNKTQKHYLDHEQDNVAISAIFYQACHKFHHVYSDFRHNYSKVDTSYDNFHALAS